MHAKILLSPRGSLGRTAKLDDEGPGSIQVFIQVATGRFLWGIQFQTQLLHSIRQDAENIGVHAWAAHNTRGWVCGTSLHLKPPMTGCRPSRCHCFHRMKPDRSQPQRDAGPGG